MSQPAAGWYADPSSPQQLRWFDGTRWSDHTRPLSATVAPETSDAAAVAGVEAPAAAPGDGATPTRKRPWVARHKVLTGVGVAAALVVGGSIAASGGGSAEADDPAAVVTHAATPSQSADSASKQAADQKAAEKKAADQKAAEKKAADQKAAEKKAADQKAAATPGIGDKARDGKFEFTVTKVQKGVKQVGDQYLNEKAQGQFVLVHVTVKNIGSKSQTFFDSNQQLADTAGRTFDADTGAGIYLEDSNAFIEEINPGNSVKGVLVFDVPKNVQLSTIELHDSMFSGGVTVSLR